MAERAGNAIRSGRVPHTLLYQGEVQAARWRKLYERWSPFATRPDFRAFFEKCLAETAKNLSDKVTVVGLGCGTGAKDVALIERLRTEHVDVSYVPVDVSVSLVTTAVSAAGAFVDREQIHPLVADVEHAVDLDTWLAEELSESSGRVFTFFSMLPNFMPDTILPRIVRWMRPGDHLLLTVNLAPGPELVAGMTKILPQYDNAETRSWLLTFLEQGGVRIGDGELKFVVEQLEGHPGVGRVLARWRWLRAGRLHLLAGEFQFAAGDELELFFSCRYQASILPAYFEKQGLAIEDTWTAPGNEEAVYLCRVAGDR